MHRPITRPKLAVAMLARTRDGLAAALTAGLLCGAISASAATLQEAQNLLRQGQQGKALEEANELVSANPKDRQARFLKGVILAEMNRLDEAAAVFTKLTEEAPELPEPYNNLAVIYAQQKQYDKARAALEMSIRTHPTYATAHENLGDLYTQMARQAYDRALQIDSSNSNAQAKLKLLREIMTVSGRTAAPVATAPAARPTVVAAASSTAAALPATPPARPVAPAAGASSMPSAISTSAALVTKPTPPAEKPVEKTVEKPVEKPAASNERAEVQKAVEAWAAAWSRKDVKAYLAAYAKDFDVPGNASRKSWEQERESRIAKPGNIKVQLSDVRVQVDGDKATVRFRQQYSSATLNTTSTKTLVLVQRGNRWLIQQERVGR